MCIGKWYVCESRWLLLDWDLPADKSRLNTSTYMCSHKSTAWRLVKYWSQSLKNNTHTDFELDQTIVQIKSLYDQEM